MELIRTEKLNKSYASGDNTIVVLKDLNLEILKGETLAIVGPSGAGKSTLLNVLGALDRPNSGEIFFKGKALSTYSESALATFRNKNIGFVFQSHHLLSEFSALENVMLPALIGGLSYAEASKKAKNLLSEVGLGKRLTHKPGQLSGGEQQRCAIVRALLQEPEVILADEPTGNLDTTKGEEVFNLLLRFNLEKKVTLIMVTHNEALASRMEKRLVMKDGLLSSEN
ncbi:MAG: ABC transporter ATP-binding protein [Deltaproteobacteria bacterium]|nr:ABC transporter ATP-binding protein [Deltaproteobacteria bacterium]